MGQQIFFVESNEKLNNLMQESSFILGLQVQLLVGVNIEHEQSIDGYERRITKHGII